jgi:hypothetical protein
MLALVLLWAAQASAFQTWGYFPLPDGATWTASVSPPEPDVGASETLTVAGSGMFAGLLVKILRDQRGSEQYLTNDALGVRLHGVYSVGAGGNCGNETDTYSPPIQIAAADMTVGVPVYSSGTAFAADNVCGTLSLSYNATSVVVAIEPSVTVPAGTFANPVRLHTTVNYSGTVNGQFVSFSQIHEFWLVLGIGEVRGVQTHWDGSITTYELTSYSVPDILPDPFSFAPKSAQAAGEAVVSDPVTVSGLAGPAPIAVANGDYQINGAGFTISPGTVNNGDQVRVRVFSGQPGVAVTATLTIGGVSADFVVTTVSDTAPDAFSIAPVNGAPLGILVGSGGIAVTGINAPAPISIAGGEYSVSGGAFTSAAGTVAPFSTVRVRVASAASYGATTSATLTIGGVSAAFDVTTQSPGDDSVPRLYYVSQPGDYVGAGETRVFNLDTPGSTFSVTRNYAGGISLAMYGGSDYWNLDLDAPGTGPLVPGRYEGATRFPFHDSGAGLSFIGYGRGCNTVTGRFDVLEVLYAANGDVQRFAANFEQHCEGAAPALFGEVRYNSSLLLGASTIRRWRADLTGEGRSDVVWRHANGSNLLWQMGGAAIAAAAPLPAVFDANWTIAGIGDFNGDGRADLLWRHALTGQVFVWLMNGASVVATGSPGTVDLQWRIEGAADFDGDGKADVLWRHAVTGAVYVWLMNGLSLSSAGAAGVVGDANWKIVGLGDLDGDGRADIVWRRDGTGANFAWLMNGHAIGSSGPLLAVADASWKIVAVGDTDGDGKADLLWRHTSGINRWWKMNGLSLVTGAALPMVPDANWQVQAIGDYDGDGRSDLFWRNILTGVTFVWLLDGAAVSASASPAVVPDLSWKVQSPK